MLDGIENEAWTGFECGYARARGKYLLGIATTLGSARRSRFEAMCEEPWFTGGGWIADYDEARRRAAATGRPIVAYFTRSFAP